MPMVPTAAGLPEQPGSRSGEHAAPPVRPEAKYWRALLAPQPA